MQTIVNALQQNDYITGVTPITEGGNTIGYTITFAQNKPLTIYHGKDGEKGEQGNKGEDGITPQFKIENGYWYVSYDNKTSWQQVGPSTSGGDGAFFEEVTEDENYVHMTLNGEDKNFHTEIQTAFDHIQ